MPSSSSFFERYADAYLAFEADALLCFYDLPAIIVDNQGDHLMSRETDLLDYMRPFLGRLEENDLGRIDPEISAKLSLGDDSCFASVRYRFVSGRREMLGDFLAHYVLMAQDEGWRIKFAKVGQVYSWNI
ncbi:MAG: hypothetical protein ACR2RA_01605 [Geminicoccaceae bacterium]